MTARSLRAERRSAPLGPLASALDPVLLDLVRMLRAVIAQLERCDPDLARQCRRALASAPLNVAEGSYSRGKNRAARYHTALGSLREALACIEVAEALGYAPEVAPEVREAFDHVLGTLVRLVRPVG